MAPTITRFNQTTKVATLTDAATINIDCNSVEIGTLTLTQNCTIATPTGNPVEGQLLLLVIKSANSFTLTFDTGYEAASSLVLPSATTGSNKIDSVAFRRSTTQNKWIFVGTTIRASLPPSAINRNYFKNPAFSVIQGTASGTLANSLALPTASLGYLGETEWCIAASGGTPAYAFSAADERVTFTGAASTTAIYLLQRLESRDANRLKNKTVTFSCEISNSLLTSVIWEVFRPTTTNDTHGTIATPTQTLIASGTFTVSSTLARYSATFALPDLASRGLEVRLRVGAQTSGTWVVSRLQLEEGSLATNFNCGDYSEELAKCQRFFERIDFINGQNIGVGSTITTFAPPLAAGVRFDFKQSKPIQPVVALSSASTFLVAGATASTVSAVADTVGATLQLQASLGSTGSSWTCVPVAAMSGAFLSASAHII